VFSLLVNSNSKLQSLKDKFERGILTAYTRAVDAVVDAIFHIPGVQNKALADHWGDITKGNHPNPNIYFEDNDNPKRDDDLEKINGLSFSKMETLLQQVSDGKISCRAWADAAMMMLGMAGGKLSLLFITFCPFIMPKGQAIDVHKCSLH